MELDALPTEPGSLVGEWMAYKFKNWIVNLLLELFDLLYMSWKYLQLTRKILKINLSSQERLDEGEAL